MDLTLTLTVNGEQVTRSAPSHHTLLRWLRDTGVWDVRYGCGEGICGTCSVLVDGKAVSSCLVLAAQVDGHRIVTAAGLSEADEGLVGLKELFLEGGAVQCGFCTSGMLVAGAEIVSEANVSSRDDVVQALEGNLCRCTGYAEIVDAILAACDKKWLGRRNGGNG